MERMTTATRTFGQMSEDQSCEDGDSADCDYHHSTNRLSNTLAPSTQAHMTSCSSSHACRSSYLETSSLAKSAIAVEQSAQNEKMREEEEDFSFVTEDTIRRNRERKIALRNLCNVISRFNLTKKLDLSELSIIKKSLEVIGKELMEDYLLKEL